jgi:hypothetical protein
MAIFGIGASYNKQDVSGKFIRRNIVGIGWTEQESPELHQLVKTLRVGDIVYIKSVAASSRFIYVKAIGVISDVTIRTAEDTDELVQIGRNTIWLSTRNFQIRKPSERNNVRYNSIYQEFHPEVQSAILRRLRARRGQ